MQNDMISRSTLLKEAAADGAYGYVDATQIADAPAVDAVEVVRCKDCKWLYDGKDMYCCTTHTGLVLIKRDGSSFCSYGERRAGDGNDN